MARLSVTDSSTAEARALGRAGAGPSTGAAGGALNLGGAVAE